MTTKELAVNRLRGPKKKPRGKPFTGRGDPRNNIHGAPRRGESWAEVIKRIGEMTPADAAERSLILAKQLMEIGNGVTLKEAVAIRVYAALIFDPDARLLNAIMDRAEGRVAQTVNIMDARDKVVELLRDGKIRPADVEAELGHDLATELFIAAGIATVTVAEADPTGDRE